MKTPHDIISDILRREGDRYTNHPADRGGPTKYGITLLTLAAYRDAMNAGGEHPSATAADVERLTEVEARAIYSIVFLQQPDSLLLLVL